MHDAVLVRARSGRGQEDIGLAPLVIGSRAFAVYPPELAEPVSRALATSLALFRRKLSVPGELTSSLALFRRKLSVPGELTSSLALFRRKLSVPGELALRRPARWKVR
jgi:hypothetical protein